MYLILDGVNEKLQLFCGSVAEVIGRTTDTVT